MAVARSASTQVKPKEKVVLRKRLVNPKVAKQTHLAMTPEGARNVFIEYNLPATHSYEDVCRPEYWANIIKNFLRPIVSEGDYRGCILQIRPVDLRFYAERMIVDVSKVGLVTEELSYKEFGAQPDEVVGEKFSYNWNETVHGYDIIRKADNAVVVNGKDCRRLDNVKAWLEQWDK